MKKKQITSYTLAWHPGENKGYAKINLGNEIKKVPIDSAAEFTAVASILRNSPVFVNKEGLIHTDWEDIEDNN